MLQSADANREMCYYRLPVISDRDAGVDPSCCAMMLQKPTCSPAEAGGPLSMMKLSKFSFSTAIPKVGVMRGWGGWGGSKDGFQNPLDVTPEVIMTDYDSIHYR